MPRRRSQPESSPVTSPTPKRRRYNLRQTAARRRRLADNPEGRSNTLTDDEFRDKIPTLKERRAPEKALVVQKVDPLTYPNRKQHNTYDYDQEDLILRRGQLFKIDLLLDRDIDVENDIITIQLVYGARPKESKGTVVRIPLDISGKLTNDFSGCWTASSERKDSRTLRVTLTSPADASIGRYTLYTETKLKDDKEFSRTKSDVSLVLIFNPWCKDDSVYMEDSASREEYVLNDSGLIWVGSKWRNRGRPWNFGQFDSPVLEAVFYLLDLAELSDEARNSPVSIVRTISAYVNSLDNEGILEGRWTAEYPDDCTKPTAWTGSVAIIREYIEKKQPVRYGQCWVFSGLTTTLLRSVGIPTRSVTTFESAHDTDCSMTIDRHYNKDGDPLDYLDDSVWNFHVWNESWFKRYDLPDGYDGWQAHDGTPQELSEGIMRCGPAPLRAIKEGHVYLNYDVGFIYSEVNGDRIVWEVDEEDGTMAIQSIDKHSVGWFISTKAVDSDDVEILDNNYKYPEFSEDERRVAKFVSRFGTRRKENIYKIETKREIEFNLKTPENAMAGEDFRINGTVKNISAEKREIVVKATLVNSYYTGLPGKRVKAVILEESLEAGEEKTIEIPVSYKEYGPTMNPEGRFQMFISGKNKSTGRMHASEVVFMLNKPDIILEVPEEVEYGEGTEAKVTFKNETCLTLTQCTFNVESPGVLDAVTFSLSGKLLPGKEWTETVQLKPRRKYRRRREIVAEFTSKELVGIEGSCKFKVVNKNIDSDDEI